MGINASLEGFLSSITQCPNNINGVTAGMQWYCFFCGHLEPHEVKNDETCGLCGSRLPKCKIEDGSLVEKRWNEYREFQKTKDKNGNKNEAVCTSVI